MRKIACILFLQMFSLSMSTCWAGPAKEIVFYNWKDYTDQSVLDDFQKQFGIKVMLKEYETKDMMLSEVQSYPGEFDVINAVDAVPLLIQFRLIEELDLSRIPNSKFIKEQFRNLPFDPEGKYSLPAYLWGTAGLLINTNFVPADTDSWAILWDEKYKGKIALMDDCREAMAAVLKYSGFSVNATDPKELEIAKANALRLRDNGVQFGDTFGNIEKVINGELCIAQVFNGDVFYKAKERNDIKFVLPAEGFSFSVDNFVISIDSGHKEEAHQLINFLMEPKNAARAANMFIYPPAVKAEAFIDKEILNNPIIYPPREILQKGEFFNDLGADEDKYVEVFNLMKQ